MAFNVSMRQCRYCKYYKNAPHKIIWEFTGEENEYGGYCTEGGQWEHMKHLKAGDSCYYFVKKTQVGPVMGAYNKGASK